METNIEIKENYRSLCFLSLPHGFGTVRKALTNEIKTLGGNTYYVIVSRADTLRNEIRREIDKCSILIADISAPIDDKGESSKCPRPTIMWEIGYATALSLKIIYICQRKDQDFVPAMLRSDHILFYDVDNLDPMLTEIKQTLLELIATQRDTESQIFKSNCYLNRRSARLESRYLEAHEKIKILELNLETVTSQVPIILTALTNNPKLSVQILTLNPFSKWAEDRANQIAELPMRYRLQLFNQIKETIDGLSKISNDRWGLKIYDTFPTQIMFQVDENLIHSIISLGRRSRNMLHFEVQNTQPNASDTFEAHFAQLWSSSVSYDEWYKQYEKAVQKLIESSSTSENTQKKRK